MDRARRGFVIGALFSTCWTALAVETAMLGPAAAQTEPFPVSKVTVEAGRGRFSFTVELADTGERRIQGLQGRRALAADAGMLFDFQTPRIVSMWMKDTYLPLDMIFIGADGVILNVVENTVPHSLAPVVSSGPALAVLEVNVGTAARLGIKAGDRVRHPIFDGGG